MRQILVIKEGVVQATHGTEQLEDVKDRYPGYEIVTWEGTKQIVGNQDPRTQLIRLADARSNRLQALQEQFKQLQLAGVTVQQYILVATVEAQSRFASLLTGLTTGLQFGGVTLTDQTTIWDAQGLNHDIIITDYIALAIEYMSKCMDLEKQLYRVQVELKNASTLDEINSVNL